MLPNLNNGSRYSRNLISKITDYGRIQWAMSSVMGLRKRTCGLASASLNFNGKLKPSKPASYSVDADFDHCHSDSKE